MEWKREPSTLRKEAIAQKIKIHNRVTAQNRKLNYRLAVPLTKSVAQKKDLNTSLPAQMYEIDNTERA